jgi:hypothetical protein
MLIRFLKSNNASALIFLPLIALAIWAFGFVHPSVVGIKHTMPLYELTAGLLVNTPWLATLIGFLLVTAEAFLLNYIINNNEVLNKQTYLPALFYIIFMSYNNSMLMFHPLLFANLFILFSINKLLSSYRKENAFSQSFDAGLLIAIATLFYFPYIIFLPILGAGLIIMRPFNWREWIISSFGIIVPYVLAITFYFWNDLLDYFLYDKLLYTFTQPNPSADFFSGLYFTLSVMGFILLFAIGKIVQGEGMGSQKTKKSITLFSWFFLFSIFSGIIAPELSTKYFSALAIPASVFCANYFANIKKQWWAEFLFILLICSIFSNLIVHFF